MPITLAIPTVMTTSPAMLHRHMSPYKGATQPQQIRWCVNQQWVTDFLINNAITITKLPLTSQYRYC